MSLEIHPLAEIFPPLREEELAELADDINANGLCEPIVLHEGKILDGRNRYLACTKLGIEPTTRAWDGNGDPLDYVISKNLRRRHLSETQRAVVAAKLATLKQGARTDLAQICARSQAEAAERLNVSRRSVQNAHVVAESGIPELQAMVAADEVSVSAASTIATLPKRRQLELVARGSKSIARAAKRIKVRRGSRLKAKHKHNAKAASEDLGDEADERSHEPPAKIDDLGDPSVDEEDPQSCRVAFLLRTDLASNALRDCRVLMQRYEGKVGKSITTDISKAARAVATAWSALAFSLERAADGNAGSSEIVECDRVDSPEAA